MGCGSSTAKTHPASQASNSNSSSSSSANNTSTKDKGQSNNGSITVTPTTSTRVSEKPTLPNPSSSNNSGNKSNEALTSNSTDGSTSENNKVQSVDEIHQKMKSTPGLGSSAESSISMNDPSQGAEKGKGTLKSILPGRSIKSPNVLLPTLGPLEDSENPRSSSGQEETNEQSLLANTIFNMSAAEKFLSLKNNAALAKSKDSIQVFVRVCPPRRYDDEGLDTGSLCTFVPSVVSTNTRSGSRYSQLDSVASFQSSSSPTDQLSPSRSNSRSDSLALEAGPILEGEAIHSSVYLTNPASEDTVSYSFENCFWSTDVIKSSSLNPDRTFHHMYTARVASAENSPQEEVVSFLANRLLNEHLQGFNTSFVTYGAAKTGKSYTCFGRHLSPFTDVCSNQRYENGVFQEFASLLFQVSAENTRVLMSAYQVKDNLATDLLTLSATQPQFDMTHLTHNEILGPSVVGVTESLVQDIDHLHTLLKEAMQVRAYLALDISDPNYTTTTFVSLKIINDSGVVTSSFVDLGSSDAVFSYKDVALMKHGSASCGLPAIRNVIRALGKGLNSRKKIAVPYEDSMLTYLLRDAIGGNSKTLWVSCISPSVEDFDETHLTLQYSNKLKHIVNTPAVESEALDPRGLHAMANSLKERLGHTDDKALYKELQVKAMYHETLATTLESDKDSLAKMTDAVARQRCLHFNIFGINVPESEAQISLTNAHVALVNLSTDATLAECIHFKIPFGVITVGLDDVERRKSMKRKKPKNKQVQRTLEVAQSTQSSDSTSQTDNRITLSGPSIAFNHAMFERRIKSAHYRGSDDKFHAPDELLSVYPLDGDVFVNGERIQGWTRLNPFDRVIIGMTHFFRVEIAEKPAESVDLESGDQLENERQHAEAKSAEESLWEAQGQAVSMDDYLNQLPQRALENILSRLSVQDLMKMLPLHSRFQRVAAKTFSECVSGEQRLITVRFALKEIIRTSQFLGYKIPSLMNSSSSSSTSSSSSSTSPMKHSTSRSGPSNTLDEIPWLLLHDVWSDGDDDPLWSSYERKLLNVNVKTMHQQLALLRQKRLMYGSDPLSPFSVQILQKTNEVKSKFGPFDVEWKRYRAKETSERKRLESWMMVLIPACFGASMAAKRMGKHNNSTFFSQFQLATKKAHLKISREALKAGLNTDKAASVMHTHMSEVYTQGPWFECVVIATRMLSQTSQEWPGSMFLVRYEPMRRLYDAFADDLINARKSQKAKTLPDPFFEAPVIETMAEVSVALVALGHMLDVNHESSGLEMTGAQNKSYGFLFISVEPIMTDDLEYVEEPADMVGFPLQVVVRITRAQRLPKEIRNRKIHLEYDFFQEKTTVVEPVSRIENGLVMFSHEKTFTIPSVTTAFLAYLQADDLVVQLKVSENVVVQKDRTLDVQVPPYVAGANRDSVRKVAKVSARSQERLAGVLNSRKRASSVYNVGSGSMARDSQIGVASLDLTNLQANIAVDHSSNPIPILNDANEQIGMLHVCITPVDQSGNPLHDAEIDSAEDLIGDGAHYAIDILRITQLEQKLDNHPLQVRLAFHTVGNVVSPPFLGDVNGVDINYRAIQSMFIVAPDFVNFLNGSLKVVIMLCPSKLEQLLEEKKNPNSASKGKSMVSSPSNRSLGGSGKSLTSLPDLPAISGTQTPIRSGMEDEDDSRGKLPALKTSRSGFLGDAPPINDNSPRQVTSMSNSSFPAEQTDVRDSMDDEAATVQQSASRFEVDDNEVARVQSSMVTSSMEEPTDTGRRVLVEDDDEVMIAETPTPGPFKAQQMDAEQTERPVTSTSTSHELTLEDLMSEHYQEDQMETQQESDSAKEEIALEELPSPAEIQEMQRKKELAALRAQPKNQMAAEDMTGVHIGFAMLDMMELSYNLEKKEVLNIHIANKAGKVGHDQIGKLYVELIPISESGLTADEDIDLLVEDPEDLVGKRVDLILRIVGAGDMIDKFRDNGLFVQYQFYGDKTMQSTALSRMVGGESVNDLDMTHGLHYERVITYHLVSPKLLEFYTTPLLLRVYRDGEPEPEPGFVSTPNAKSGTPKNRLGINLDHLTTPNNKNTADHPDSGKKRSLASRMAVSSPSTSILNLGIPEGVEVDESQRRLIGQGQVDLNILTHSMTLEFDEGVHLFDSSGFQVGSLDMKVTPLNSFGREDSTLFCDEPEELVGQTINLLIEFNRVNGLASRLDNSRLFLEYQFFGDSGKLTSDFFKGGVGKVGYKRVFHLDEASPEYLDFLEQNPLDVTVWRFVETAALTTDSTATMEVVDSKDSESSNALSKLKGTHRYEKPEGFSYVASADVSLVALSFGLEMESEVKLVGFDGEYLGMCEMLIVPVQVNSDEQDEDMMVEDEQDLVGLNMHLLFTLHKFQLNVDKPFCIEFGFYNHTNVCSMVMDPSSEKVHEKQFFARVAVENMAKGFIEYLQTGNLHVQLHVLNEEAADGGLNLSSSSVVTGGTLARSGLKVDQSTSLASSLRKQAVVSETLSKEGWEVVGQCPLYLNALAYNIEIENATGWKVVNTLTEEIGNLELEIMPEDDDLLVDNPEELLGQPIEFNINISGLNGLVEQVTKTHNEFCCRYSFFGDIELQWTKASMTVAGDPSVPRLSYTRKVSVPKVTQEFLDFTESPMNIEVLGRHVEHPKIEGQLEMEPSESDFDMEYADDFDDESVSGRSETRLPRSARSSQSSIPEVRHSINTAKSGRSGDRKESSDRKKGKGKGGKKDGKKKGRKGRRG